MRSCRSLFKATFNHVPVDNVPQSGQVVNATVLVIQIVSVFPNVYSQNGVVAMT